MNLTASGSSISAGNAEMTGIVPAALTANGASVSTGSAVVTSLQPLGAATDFGVWPSWMPDPAVSCITAVSAADTTGRAYLSATVPTQYDTALGTLWNAAASTAATGTWKQGSGLSTSVTQIQVEHAPGANLLPVDGADYRDQLVYQQTSATSGNTTIWDASVTRVKGHALSGTWCGQMANIGGMNPYSMGPLPQACASVVTGAEYKGTVSLSIARAGTQWNALILWFDQNFDLVGTSTGPTNTHPGSLAYQQGRAVGTAPAANQTNGPAVYAAVVPSIVPVAVGDGELAWADCHRLFSLQPSATSAPAAFEPARQQNITLKANRVNYFTNPSLTEDLTGWWSIGGTQTNPGTWDGTVGRSAPGSMKISVPYVAGSAYPQVGTYVQGVGGGPVSGIAPGKSGETYTLSVYVLPLDECPTLRIFAVLGGGDGGIYIQGNTTEEVSPDADGWYRLSVTCTIPESVSGTMTVLINMSDEDWTAHAADIEFWVDDALAENSPLLGTYFDATLPSPDYLWEGTPLRSRSHYYQNLRFLQYRLSELLKDALPVGAAYQLLFAQPDS